jgi:hypothetical protein
MYAFQLLVHLSSLVTFLHFCIAAKLPSYSTDLGITLNQITKTNGPRVNFMVYTSLVEYEKDVSQFSNEEFAGLARQGTWG